MPHRTASVHTFTGWVRPTSGDVEGGPTATRPSRGVGGAACVGAHGGAGASIPEAAVGADGGVVSSSGEVFVPVVGGEGGGGAATVGRRDFEVGCAPLD